MDDKAILEGLEELLSSLAISLRYDKGDFVGGIYRYRGQEQVLINKELNLKQKINVLANELSMRIDLDNCYLVPALREVIENASRLG